MLDLSSAGWKSFYLLLGLSLLGALGFYWLARYIRRSLWGFFSGLGRLAQLGENAPVPGPPRSLQSMESLVLPQIKKDFPELNIESMRAQVNRLLSAAINADSSVGAAEALSVGERALPRAWWENFIAQNSQGAALVGRSVYRVVIKDYVKSAQQCRIVWQAGFFYERDAQAGFSGRVDFVYLYDLKAPAAGEASAVKQMKCPNCGAPFAQIGEKICHYCHSSLNVAWDKVWSLAQVQSA